jgi:hypothetical protein
MKSIQLAPIFISQLIAILHALHNRLVLLHHCLAQIQIVNLTYQQAVKLSLASNCSPLKFFYQVVEPIWIQVLSIIQILQ